jgi:hypothetical protein
MQKNFAEKIYHIYVGDKCIYHSLKKEEFDSTWTTLNRLAEFLTEDAELSYEEVLSNKRIMLESSY